ncbi:hypothetical protein GPJ56_004588 [Histomonas meleagridis]|uniref:uncharacterized protein n=1 Tax=Histomonas meleagridis TaxID=135588 RepID=UPI00355946C5|nr:hypothetical protein GPJ56_004588 [Histomonas meleagridis]KAH0799757.1 hypothetical protein GO595_007478 [Histomonas meleagridis]
MMFDPTTSLDDFETISELGNGNTIKVKPKQQRCNDIYIIRKIPQSFKNFDKVYNEYLEFNHPNKVEILQVIKPNTSNPGGFIMPYYENRSLYIYLSILQDGNEPKGWSPNIKILYGIASFMKSLHEKEIIHGRLTLFNIFVSDDFSPIISDFMFYNIYPIDFKNDISDHLNVMISMAPEVLLSGAYSYYSDVYSFGILMLQLLTSNFDVYAGRIKKENLFEAITTNKAKPLIPTKLPNEIRNLIKKCLEKTPESRPSFDIIEEFLSNINKKQTNDEIPSYNEYISKITSDEQVISEDLLKKKKMADEGNIYEMFQYGIKLYEEKPTAKSEIEGIKYIQKAANEGNEQANLYITTILDSQNENNEKEESQKESIQKETKEKKKEKKFSLYSDPFFNENSNIDFNPIIKQIETCAKEPTEFLLNENDLENENFIFTEGAKDRLAKIFDCLKVGIPVLLEGPTGTSKTLSTEIICKLMKKKLIRFNLSSETKTCDLFGRYVGEPNSWAGIVVKPGPFLQACKNGYWLLLDEINLASPVVLQCIEEALDSGIISVEIPGMPLEQIKIHPDFRLIATQNPNKGLFANKRQDLGPKFLSRFQIINFPEFTKEELLKIGLGLAKKFKYKSRNEIIEQLVDFHMEWSEKPDIAEDIFCFTVREIAATVKALADGADIYDTIMTIYGARYPKKLRDELETTLQKYPYLNQKKNNIFQYPNDFPECFRNESLTFALKSILFSIKNHRHILITGPKGCGKTSVSKWVSEYRDKQNNNYNPKKELYCLCTEETKCSDLIGKQKPIENTKSGNFAGKELIQWKDGFLTLAMESGGSPVLDDVDEATSTVTERLNSALDEKYNDKEQKMFDIPENPQKNQIPIHKNFLLICTCNIDKLHLISPAFLNRFDVIVLENQLDSLNEKSMKELIQMLMNRFNKFEQTNEEVKDQGSENDDEEIVFFDDNDNEYSDNEYSINNDYEEIIINDDNDNEEIIINDEKEEDLQSSDNHQPEEVHNEQKIKSPELTPNLIDEVYKKISKSEITMYWLAFLCKAVVIYSNLLSDSGIQQKDIVEFSINMLKKNEDFKPNKDIQNYLFGLLTEDKINNSQFFFMDSPPLCEFMTKIYAASLIGLPVCVSGPTGAGKTSAARAFASLRKIQTNYNTKFQMHSFHAGTKPNHFYGTTTIKNGKIYFYNGTLTVSMKEGLTFIADEMNLSTPGCMKTLAPALEPCIGGRIFIPGVGESISVNKNFFFIACQNELGTLGRNVIPESISSRFRYFTYPEQGESDISKIC